MKIIKLRSRRNEDDGYGLGNGGSYGYGNGLGYGNVDAITGIGYNKMKLIKYYEVKNVNGSI